MPETSSIADKQTPKGWFIGGNSPSDYDIGVDSSIFHGGKASGCLKSQRASNGFGTLMQMFKADKYRGQRLRLSAYVKFEQVDDWAGLWMRVDDADKETLAFDNMYNRQLKGTSEWQKYDIVLDVPENSAVIAFGVLLNGEGQVWIDDLTFEVVSRDVPVTSSEDQPATYPDEPVNLDFENS